MSQTIVEILAGVLLAAGLVVWARSTGRRGEIRVYAIGLVVAALVYLGFALIDAGAGAIGVELLGVLTYSTVALLGWKRNPPFLAFGWAAHVAWDTLLHLGPGSSSVPGLYPTLCIGFDFTLAGYILVATANGRLALRETPTS